MFNVYSFGIDSPLKFRLSARYVKLYNTAMTKFFLAQAEHKHRTGSKWSPDEPLSINMSKKEMAAFNSFDAILQKALKRHKLPVYEEDLTSDYLIKN